MICKDIKNIEINANKNTDRKQITETKQTRGSSIKFIQDEVIFTGTNKWVENEIIKPVVWHRGDVFGSNKYKWK